MSSTQTIDSTPAAGPKLAIGLECPPCGAVRTYILDATLRLVLEREWQAVRLEATCHCGHKAVAALGWHEPSHGFSSRPIKVSAGVVPRVLDDAGICPGCNRADAS